ncbi:glycosyltransferase family 4 protein [Carboxydothermus ferrireducens]|uniref:Glycosyltransferase involved in cell wall biosynthesis n=1 Tax=Carboxydothermus ferrireducens DSM 11255 TaxID=1119529 RepID=A0ABX2RAS9_9THEO|nr:glycosyltransferase family 4 protein [Carboxydothermus ferrireducens]NYE56952.1 glycosyltransferase involved in cell wall biosynthesis [Carboxydothermus ferrireducens DSM 11255]
MKKKIKLLHLITLSEAGGAQKVLYHIVSGLNPEEYDITVMAAPGGELFSWLKDYPYIKLWPLPEMEREIVLTKDFKLLLKLIGIFKKEKFDIVHCHSTKAGIVGRIAAFFARVPVRIFTVHGWVFDLNQPLLKFLFYVWAERLAGLFGSMMVTVSREDYRKGLEYKITRKEKLTYIPNGLPEIITKKGKLRQELGISDEIKIVGTVFRLAPPKDLELLLKTAEMVIKNWDRVVFVVVGDGPQKEWLRAEILKRGLSEKIHLLGHREDVYDLLGDFNVFTLFSRHEGLPVSILEAMAAGLPVVASKVGGIPELVYEGENGFLVDEGDAEKAFHAIISLLQDGELRFKMGKRSFSIYSENYTVEKMVSSYDCLYKKLLKDTEAVFDG